jgi:DNA polymerase/3'-5' exonuclease PolX
MAKALLGYMNQTDPRVAAALAGENRRLRQLVADLQAQVSRLETENDALAATLSSEGLLAVPDQMQPA